MGDWPKKSIYWSKPYQLKWRPSPTLLDMIGEDSECDMEEDSIDLASALALLDMSFED